MKYINKISLSLALVSVVFAGCDKTKPYDIFSADSFAHFTGAPVQTYSILEDPAPVYNVAIGTNDVSDADRTVSYTISSPTGAASGTHYANAASGSITIPAGKSVALFPLQANYNQYTTGRKDTLLIALTPGTVAVGEYFDTLKVVLRGPCFEGDVSLPALTGLYKNTNEMFSEPYGPYTTSVTAVSTGPTSATFSITGLWAPSWGPIQFNADWTDPANRTVTVVPQTSGIADAGTLSSSYAGYEVAVRPFAGQTGTFSACDNSFVLRFQLGVAGVGYFSTLYTVTMER